MVNAGNIEKRSKEVEKKKKKRRKRAVPTIPRANYPLQSYFDIPEYSKCLDILNYSDVAYNLFSIITTTKAKRKSA
jgi:hypothetical protein